MKYIVLAIIYAYVLFMAWSAFGWMGVAYVVIVPIPFIVFSYLVRKRKKMDNPNPNRPVSFWTSPIPYFSILFVALILFQIFN